MSSLCTSNLTSGFIDLATYDESEKFMYGGPDSTAYFVRETRKATWFTLVPVCLTKASGNPGWGAEWSVNISRAGDYLLHAWLRAQVPSVTLNQSNTTTNKAVRWTKNLGHNLIKECVITFNDLVAARFDNWHLDFWAAFTTPASKQYGYDLMIGNSGPLSQAAIVSETIPSGFINVPLPLFFTRDSGVALPTAALPYNEMRIQFQFRDWSELLVMQPVNGASYKSDPSLFSTFDGSMPTPVLSSTDVSLGNGGNLSQVQVWANYAIVANEERKRMACAPRDILIEQVQTAPNQTFAPATNPQPSYDIRFSHAVKALFFAAQNTSCKSAMSLYTVQLPTVISGVVPGQGVGTVLKEGNSDPIATTSLVYENTQRLNAMGSDYFSLVNPWFHAPTIPSSVGLHTYSYSLDFMSLDPMGSTNYGKLTNVSILPVASLDAVSYNSGSQSGDSSHSTNAINTYQFITTAINNNIIRISGGALGFPVL